MSQSLINFIYIISSVMFIMGIKMLGKAETARMTDEVIKMSRFILILNQL